MKLGRLELLLVILVVAGLGWLGSGLLRGRHVDMCSPLPLSQDVKAYIDSKIAASGNGQCGEIPAMVAKLSDLEVKMGGLDAYRVNIAERDAKKNELAMSNDALRASVTSILNRNREVELARMKSEIANVCAASGGPIGKGGGRRGFGGGGNGNGGGDSGPPPSIPPVQDDSKPAAGASSESK